MSAPRAVDPIVVAIEVLERMPELVRLKRWQEGLSARAAAEEAGVSFSTLNRYERGQQLPTKGVLPVLTWLRHGARKSGSTTGGKRCLATSE
jgi:ribosome-binding protein aMBF1 (putative translation factor)